jgi:hypothetical protein
VCGRVSALLFSSPVWMSVCRILHRYIPKSVFLCIYYFRELVQFGSPDETITTALIMIPVTSNKEHSCNLYCIIWNTSRGCILLQCVGLSGIVIVSFVHDDQLYMFLSPVHCWVCIELEVFPHTLVCLLSFYTNTHTHTYTHTSYCYFTTKTILSLLFTKFLLFCFILL